MSKVPFFPLFSSSFFLFSFCSFHTVSFFSFSFISFHRVPPRTYHQSPANGRITIACTEDPHTAQTRALRFSLYLSSPPHGCAAASATKLPAHPRRPCQAWPRPRCRTSSCAAMPSLDLACPDLARATISPRLGLARAVAPRFPALFHRRMAVDLPRASLVRALMLPQGKSDNRRTLAPRDREGAGRSQFFRGSRSLSASLLAAFSGLHQPSGAVQGRLVITQAKLLEERLGKLYQTRPKYSTTLMIKFHAGKNISILLLKKVVTKTGHWTCTRLKQPHINLNINSLEVALKWVSKTPSS